MPNNLTAGAVPAAGQDGALSGAGPITSQGPQVDASAMQTPSAGPPAPSSQGIDIKDVYDVIHKQSAVDAKLRKLLDKDGPITRKDVTQVAIELVADRTMSAQAIAGYLADMPEDPDALREWVEVHAKEAETQLQQLLTLIHGAEDSSHPMDAFGSQPPATGPSPTPPQVQ